VISDLYWYKPGMPAGTHIAYGSQAAAGNATIGSTANATKGMVFLGAARQTAYDETNERIGIQTATPTARLHIKHVSGGGTQFARPVISPVGAGGWGWTNSGTQTRAAQINEATADEDTTLIQSSDTTPNTAIEVSMAVPTSAAATGWSFVARARKTAASQCLDARLDIWINRTFSAGAYSGGTLVQSVANFLLSPSLHSDGTYSNFTYNLASAEATAIMGSTTWSFAFTDTGGGNAGNVKNVTQVYLTGPGTLDSTPLQRWQNPTVSNDLNYANDGAGATTLQFSGAPKLRVATSGMEIAVGSPASGSVLAATDTDGTVAWAAASSLGTSFEHVFKANGFYRVDDDVDGAWIAKKAGTLGSVTLYRRQGGTSGNLVVDLRKNGTTVLSTMPSIAFNLGASATASGIISVSSIAVGDRFTCHATASDPRGRDYGLQMVGA
jgi:hypothetical protein